MTHPESKATATVVATRPDLWILIDGSSTACPAKKLVTAEYAIGDHVIVTIRNPRLPLVEGRPS